MVLKSQVFTFLKSYSTEPNKINRLLISAFLRYHGIKKVRNELIKDLQITSSDPDYEDLLKLNDIQSLDSFEALIAAFEFVISPEDKIVTGAVYTPTHIRDFIVDYTIGRGFSKEITVCDPACGCAGFLYSAAKQLKALTQKKYKEIFARQIFGLDIQSYSVIRSKLLLSLLAIVEGEDEVSFLFNIWCGNALNFNWSNVVKNFEGFSIVIGNPPYVCSRNIDVESKQFLDQWRVCSTGHPDLYIPFFEIGLNILHKGGVLGYITMNTFFKSINGRALREYFNECSCKIKIIDFGGLQIFQSKSTYTCICLIEKKAAPNIEYVKIEEPINDLRSLKGYNKIPYTSLNAKSGWNLKEVDVISKIESVGVSFGKKYKTRNGIATLKNEVYIFIPEKKDDCFYFFTQNGKEIAIEKEACKDIINPNKLIKLTSLSNLKKKIIFPYTYRDGSVKLIDEKVFKKSFPFTFKYLSTQREVLETRDRGNGKYENWYAYGRNQSLEKFDHKLFFPHITPIIPSYLISSDSDLLFYNGLAIIGKSERELLFLEKLMSSRLFWFYIKNSSKPYGSGYYSLSRNYIKNFGVYNFTEQEVSYLIGLNTEEANLFIEEKYGINIAE